MPEEQRILQYHFTAVPLNVFRAIEIISCRNLYPFHVISLFTAPFIAQAEDKIKSSLALLEDAACIKWEDVTGTSTAYNHILFYGNTTA